MLYVLENDGHNVPSVHKFRDFKHLSEYLDQSGDFSAGCPTEDDFFEYLDDNGVTWVSLGDKPDLYLTDHTDELCPTCGERDARGMERPECECECHPGEEG